MKPVKFEENVRVKKEGKKHRPSIAARAYKEFYTFEIDESDNNTSFNDFERTYKLYDNNENLNYIKQFYKIPKQIL